MTLSSFITKWNGKKADWDNAYGGQCVDLFRFYVNEVLGLGQPKGVVGAADFWANYATDLILEDNFTQIKNTADFKPLAGDVMIWNKRAGGGFGHIAIVSDDKATLDTFNSFDQNWVKISVCEIVKHTYANVYGVLRPNKGSMTDMYNGYDLANRESMKVCVDLKVKQDKGLIVEKAKYDTDIKTLADKLKECQNSGSEIKIEPEVTITGIPMIINGATVDSNGVVTANYRIK